MYKNFFSLITFSVFALILGACNPTEVENKASYLELLSVYDTIGNTYNLSVAREIDTTYVYANVKRDTVKNADGTPQLDSHNKPIINYDTTWVAGNKTGHYVLLDTIMLAGSKNSSQVCMLVHSNANWSAPIPATNTSVNWFLTTNLTGGGSAIIRAAVRPSLKSKTRTDNVAHQYIYTKDSLVMYHLIFNQEIRPTE